MSERLQAIIIDDEAPARTIVREFLSTHDDIIVADECANGFEAVKAIDSLKPDLIFLDIQMPKLSGFEVLELIDPPCAVVFTTAFDEYALRAFEVHAVDYLLKPFSKERFDEALAHVRARIGTRQLLPVAKLSETAHSDREPADRILVRDGSRVHIIPAGRIDYLEAQDDYVAIKTAEKKFLKQTTLNRLGAKLDPNKFIRVHRSFILNIERLAKLESYAKESRVAILLDGTRIRVSRRGYAKLKELLS